MSAEPVAYATVVAAGAAMGASVLGYRLGATGTVVVNPKKSESVTLGEDDQVVLISTNSPTSEI